MKKNLSLVISAALIVSGYAQTRNVLVGTNNAVVQPTNFWSADVSNARSGLGLGSAATNPASAFQPSSTTLTNLSINNGGSLTNLNASSVVGTLSLAQGGTGSTNAATARTSLGLETAATNPASAFQPSSATLSNLASSNGGTLTNLQSSNLVGLISTSNIPPILLTNVGTTTIAQGGTGATNAVNARANLGSTTVGDALFIATNPASARTTIGATTVGSSVFTLANPSAITFLRLNADNTASALSAADFRTALGLGSASTNLSSAFQPASTVLSNLASSNALSISLGGTGATNVSTARTNLGLGWSALTNINSATSLLGFTTNGTVVANTTNVLTFSNALAFGANAATTLSNLSAASGDVGQLDVNGAIPAASAMALQGITDGALGSVFGWTTSGTNWFVDAFYQGPIRSALGLGATWLTNTNVTNFRTAIGLGATNSAFSALSVGINITNASTASDASSAFGNTITIDSTVENSLAVGFSHSMSNFGNQAGGSVLLGGMGTMTHWGAFLFNGVPQGGTAGVSRGNSTFAVNASNGIYLNGPIQLEGVSTLGSGLLSIGSGGAVSKVVTNVSTATPAFVGWSGFAYTAFDSGTARTNIGLPWTGLTNTNTATFQTALFGSNTNPVLVNTNGEVVSPTNFWQVAPIQTLVQDLTVIVTSQTNNATNARNLYVYSLATNVSGISNTILLPTNAATFAGDEVTVIHRGTTNTTTVIRQAGSTNNLITLSRFDEAVKFIRESGQWNFYHNISYVEAIQFSGTNASNNIAVTRTNLGLPLPALTNSNTTNFQAEVFQTNTTPAGAAFNNHVAWMEVNVITNGSNTSFRIPLFK